LSPSHSAHTTNTPNATCPPPHPLQRVTPSRPHLNSRRGTAATKKNLTAETLRTRSLLPWGSAHFQAHHKDPKGAKIQTYKTCWIFVFFVSPILLTRKFFAAWQGFSVK